MENQRDPIPPSKHGYSLRRSTLYAKEHFCEIESDKHSLSNAGSSYSSKPRHRNGRRIKKTRNSKKAIESSESEEDEEPRGIEPNPLDLILLNKLPANQRDLRIFKTELDKHMQKFRSSFFCETQNTKRNITRVKKRSTRVMRSIVSRCNKVQLRFSHRNATKNSRSIV